MMANTVVKNMLTGDVIVTSISTKTKKRSRYRVPSIPAMYCLDHVTNAVLFYPVKGKVNKNTFISINLLDKTHKR